VERSVKLKSNLVIFYEVIRSDYADMSNVKEFKYSRCKLKIFYTLVINVDLVGPLG